MRAFRPRDQSPALLAILAGLAFAWTWPEHFPTAMAAAALAALLTLCLAAPGVALAIWLLAIGLTPDMWAAPGNAMAIVGGLKLAGLVLIAFAGFRFGWLWDGFNPGFAFLAMFGWSALAGLHPNLDWAESARSLAGSGAPFALAFIRLPAATARRLIFVVILIPAASVLTGAALHAAGLHPVFVEGAGLRLQGAGHPAFLAGFAMAGAYAALLEWGREGRSRHLAWLILNLAILALTGARAPIAICLAVCGLALLLLPTTTLPWSTRLPVLLTGATLAVLAVIAAALFTEIRLFNLLLSEPANLSGRDTIWPIFAAAWEERPWLGWGVGAAKTLVAVDSPTARLLGTNAAHNEYLRIGVEGGYLGLALLLVLAALWLRSHLRVSGGADRTVLPLVMIGLAVHSFTDNTLIATTSSVLLTWIIASFARAAREAETPHKTQ